jgi:hypothetical protein
MRHILCVLAIAIAASPLGAQSSTDERTRLVAQIDTALARGATFLAEQPDDDGYWRSDVYGLLKDGPSLTSLALWVLPSRNDFRAPRDRGFAAMRRVLKQDDGEWRVAEKLEYPVYTASLMILADPLNVQKGGPAWLTVVREHQFNARNGWTKTDSFFGGWGYTKVPPLKSADGKFISPLDEPNLSATAFAVEAIHSAIWEQGAASGRTFEPEMQDAIYFVERCQNWRGTAPDSDARFNDGGFHFMLGDAVRNKPGVAGTDSTGELRFRSYGSATADGVWPMLVTSRHLAHRQREVAAIRWLVEHFNGVKHPGNYPEDRRSLQPALDYYYVRALLRAARDFRRANPPEDATFRDNRWVERIARELLERQRADGSWRNPAVDVREDDPLIATSFALVALRECRNDLGDE